MESGFHFKVAMVLKFQLVSGWASWALAHPEFGVSVNPFPTREADYAHLINACQSRFEKLTAPLQCSNIKHASLEVGF